MKKLLLKLLLISMSILPPVLLQAQDSLQTDFDKFRRELHERYTRYKRAVSEDFKNYRDSVNAVYAEYLRETWKEFDLYRREVRFDPMPEPPVYDPAKPEPDIKPQPVPVPPAPEPPQPVPVPPQPVPVPPQPVPVQPQPVPVPPQPEPDRDQQPVPVPEKYPVKAEFFGRQISLQSFDIPEKPLQGTSENDVADYWLSLSRQPTHRLAEDIDRIKSELLLNDWGIYLLTGKIFQTHFPHRNAGEQVVFSIFMLNQLGYRARTGIADGELVPLIAFRNRLSNTSYFRYGSEDSQVIYYLLNSDRKKEVSTLRTCGKEYYSEGKVMDIEISRLPALPEKISEKTLSFQNSEYPFYYNQHVIDFYATYPCVDFAVYGNAPLEESFLNSLQMNFWPLTHDKSQEEAVNLLLHFTQKAFSYKTDQNNYGFEKWNFAEETLVSQYSDCDDRAIFFVRAVINILQMKAVLVHYPGRHLAAAVHFDNPQFTGTHFVHDGVKYFICDPTYINAGAGMEMPKLTDAKREIIQLK
jgi:hypothetical protein